VNCAWAHGYQLSCHPSSVGSILSSSKTYRVSPYEGYDREEEAKVRNTMIEGTTALTMKIFCKKHGTIDEDRVEYFNSIENKKYDENKFLKNKQKRSYEIETAVFIDDHDDNDNSSPKGLFESILTESTDDPNHVHDITDLTDEKETTAAVDSQKTQEKKRKIEEVDDENDHTKGNGRMSSKSITIKHFMDGQEEADSLATLVNRSQSSPSKDYQNLSKFHLNGNHLEIIWERLISWSYYKKNETAMNNDLEWSLFFIIKPKTAKDHQIIQRVFQFEQNGTILSKYDRNDENCYLFIDCHNSFGRYLRQKYQIDCHEDDRYLLAVMRDHTV
jgi:hypothetical protein